jgi:hypothetical protein
MRFLAPPIRSTGNPCGLLFIRGAFLGSKVGSNWKCLFSQTGVKLRQINESVDGSITQRSVVQSVTYVSGTICYLCLGSLTFCSSKFRKTRTIRIDNRQAWHRRASGSGVQPARPRAGEPGNGHLRPGRRAETCGSRCYILQQEGRRPHDGAKKRKGLVSAEGIEPSTY